MAEYECEITDDSGVPIADSQGRSYLKEFLSLSATRVTNQIGSFEMYLPATFDKSLLKVDRMVQVWRKPTGGRKGLWRVYFIRKWNFRVAGSRKVIRIAGPDQNDLLRRRIVAAYSGSEQAKKTAFEADDMMKAFVFQAMEDSAEPIPTAGTRAWSGLSVQDNQTFGPQVSLSAPYEWLLTKSGSGVLPQIAQAARELGTEVFFDIVPILGQNSISFQFQTFIGQPGQDVTDSVVFDEQSGNMADPDYEEDYTDEVNYVYAAGQGEESSRNVQQVYDASRYSASRWNRCEGFQDARNQDSDNGVIAAGLGLLESGRPKIRFSATPLDTEGTRFGIDWDHGYKVKTRYEELEFDSIIRATTITVNDKGVGDIRARLEYES